MALRVVLLYRAILDLRWFNIYHEDTFPEGAQKAVERFWKCVSLLCAHPGMGRSAGASTRRRFAVPRTRFTIVYSVKEDALIMVRILDQRSETYLEDLFDHDDTHRPQI